MYWAEQQTKFLFYSYRVFTICLPVRLVDEYCKGFITYITLFRLTGQQSHNTQYNHT